MYIYIEVSVLPTLEKDSSPIIQFPEFKCKNIKCFFFITIFRSFCFSAKRWKILQKKVNNSVNN